MAHMLRAFCVSVATLLVSCSGGGSSPGSAPPPPPPPCCASTAIIASDFDADEQDERAAFDANRQAIESGHAAAGTYFSGAFLSDLSDNGVAYANGWTAKAFDSVDAEAPSGIDGPAIAGMVEDYRGILIDYAVADYDQVTSGGGWPAGAVAQARQEMIDGMDAAFDQLLADLNAAGYI